VGSGSIYRIIPCDEATAMSAIRSSQRRPLSMVSLVPGNRLAAPKEIHDEDEDDSSL
jgi:hypothetical protein